MLSIQDFTYRIQGRLLFDAASVQIARGWKVGLVGRNGAGKSTLLRLIREDDSHADGAIEIVKGASLGFVAQEAAPTEDALLDVVLAADRERAALLVEAETASDPHRIAEIHIRLADIEAHSAEARAAEILIGLGFRQSDLQRPCAEFSGGWRMRAALGGVLFAAPDLLLLDEPTNYLDLEGAAWLEAHLKRYPNTLLLVSHDRDVLNRSVTHILALDQGKLSVHAGGYDQYLRKRAERASQLAGERAKQDAQRAHLQKFVDRFRAKASKARQAQSRIKMLQKMQEITVPLEERTTPFHFPDPTELASPLLQLEGADLGYENTKPILRNVSLRVDHDDRIAIVGANGQGKTTLVKSIAARLALLGGDRRASKALKIGYFSQDQLDELRSGETALDHIRTLRPDAGQPELRSIAAQMGFGHEKIATKVEALSGGEKVRLLLGLTALSKPHILILDEPTSHLDIDSREALVYALNEFAGAVLLITHDVYLAEASADRVWLVKDGRAAPYDGDLESYRALILAAERAPGREPASEKPTRKAEPPPREQRSSPQTLRRRVEAAENRMETAQAALAEIDVSLAAPDLDAARLPNLMKRRAAAEAEIAEAESEWLAASELLENAAAK
ncbi:MAG: ABC-F family ATP-binding cassette domain-containing protein [Hyphomonadaceae bacterium]